MGCLQQWEEKYLLRYFGLCLSWDLRRIILWQVRGYLGSWGLGLRNVDRKGSFLSHKSSRDNEKHNEGTHDFISVQHKFPNRNVWTCQELYPKSSPKKCRQSAISIIPTQRRVSKERRFYCMKNTWKPNNFYLLLSIYNHIISKKDHVSIKYIIGLAKIKSY